MTWPGWGEVLPLLATLVTAVATVIGAVVTWARISDRTVSRAVEKAAQQSEKAAREAADGVSAEVRALAEKLATNDFPHVEARVDRGLQDMGERIERVEAQAAGGGRRDGGTDRGAVRPHRGPSAGGGSAATGHGRPRSLNTAGGGDPGQGSPWGHWPSTSTITTGSRRQSVQG